MSGSPIRPVLVAFHEEVPGGATLSVLRTLPHLEARGWSFVLWAPDPSPLADYLREEGHDVRGAPRPIAYSLAATRLDPGLGRRLALTPGYLRSFRAAIADVRPVLLHANSLFTLAEAAVARMGGVPVVFHVHEMRPAGRKGLAGTRAAARIASELVAVSAACAADLAAGGREPAVVHEGAVVPAEARLEPTGNPIVGTVGVISTRKGSDLFVEAARIVRERSPSVRFQMVGAPTDLLEHDWATEVLRRAAAIGVEHIERADVPRCLRSWTAFALPSRRDPFPISMLEAMGHGLPVVGTSVDGISEQLAEGSGVLVPADDAGALAEALIALLDDPVQREHLGRAARRRVVAHFTVEAQAEALSEVYERALGGLAS